MFFLLSIQSMVFALPNTGEPLGTSLVTSCGNEDFVAAGNDGSYGPLNWTGLNNVAWSATDARSDQDLDGAEAIILRNGLLKNDVAQPNGVGVITFKYARIYSGNSILKVFVNNIQYGGDITVSELTSTTANITVNVSGDANIRIENSGNRTLLNDLSWTCGSSGPVCAITDIALSNASACTNGGSDTDETNDYYTADVEVTYENAPTSGNLVINGTDVVGAPYTATIGTSPQTISNVQLSADGADVEITANFSAQVSCTYTETVANSAVASCSAPCTASASLNSAICDSKTSGTDTYDIVLDFLIGNETEALTVSSSVGTPNPTSISADGTVTLDNVTEGTNVTFTFTNTACSFTVDVVSPTCEEFIVEDGVIINEFSQINGIGYAAEYVECLVTGTPGTTIDLRNWIFDDNNGDFANGPGSSSGLARGYIRFSNNCTWEKVPVGSLIVFYNAKTTGTGNNGGLNMNTRYGLVDDPTDQDFNFVYVVPIDDTSSDYFEGHDGTGATPYSGTSGCTGASNAYGSVFGTPDWSSVGYRNSGDATQIRKADQTYFQGISYGTGSTTCGDGTMLALKLENHPDYPTRTTDAVYFSQSSGDYTYRFINNPNDATDNDYRSKAQWVATTDVAMESPGVGNSPANIAFINGLKGNYPPSNTNKSYSCLLRSNETRMFWDDQDDIILWVKNNGATNHGNTTAALTVTTNPPANKKNANLPDEPVFFDYQWQLQPTTTTGADYTIRFYVSEADLTTYMNFLTSNYPNSGITNIATMIAKMKMYKFNDSDDPYTTSNTPIISSITSGTYVVNNVTYYTFESSFTSFSKFKLGIGLSALPVSYNSFVATALKSKTKLVWKTESEINNKGFEIERSQNGVDFTAIGYKKGHGSTDYRQVYEYLDERPSTGVNYYRLKQYDYNGAFSYSPIRSVYFDGTIPVLNVYPTINNGVFSIEFPEEEDAYRVEVIDMIGRIHKTLNYTNAISQVDITDLASGHYFIRYKKHVKRILKK